MIAEYFFKFIVFGLIAYGIFSIITGKTISDPENGKVRIVTKNEDPFEYWVTVVSVFAFAGMLLWAGYIYAPAQLKKTEKLLGSSVNLSRE